MMIMANHPQQQQQQTTRAPLQHSSGNVGGGAHYFEGNNKKLEQANNRTSNKTHLSANSKLNHQQTSEPTIIKSTTTTSTINLGDPQHQQQQENIFIATKDSKQQLIQDGKRTLIKNQLYLIEQLQLENANLRNERDQLQLENEELKFQLQMISSSNILTQPGSAFDGQRQLERLVEGDQRKLEKLAATSAQSTNPGQPGSASPVGGATTPTNNPHHSNNLGPGDCMALMMPSIISRPSFNGNNHCDKQSNSNPTTTTTADGFSSPTRLAAAHGTKSLGQPIKLIDDDADNGFANANPNSNDRRHHGQGNRPHHQQQQQQQTSSFGSPTNGLQLNDCKQERTIDSCLQPLVASADRGNHGERSISNLASITHSKQNLITKQANSYNHLSNGTVLRAGDGDDDDDDQLRAKLVERLYGDDSEKVQAAAVTIQRAFRKYQICKRFRTITEQLRHTCQSSTSPVQQHRHGTNQSATATTSERHKREQTNYSTDKQATISTSNNSNQSSIPFVTGTTKAAAWESLSYAASRLAASAAAATATTKQVLANGVSKSASSQNVNPTNTAASPAVHLSGMQTTAGERVNGNNSTAANAEQQQQRSSLKPNSVVAAAINFQQLESIRKRQYRVGLNIFNKSPEKGVSFLIAHSFIDASTPYSKSSPGYYLSNQMHFIDKQNLVGQNQHNQRQQQLQQQQQQKQQEKFFSPLNFSSCQFCFDEENLKRNVAHFLLHRKGLAKEKIGQYLGNLQCQFNQDVLRYYLQELDFYGLQIDIALRKFLATLRLPGEAQKIERFVDCFAQRYVQCQQQQQQQQQQTVVQPQPANRMQKQSQQQQQQQTPQTTPTHTNANNNYKHNLTLLSKDEIFILTFAIIMLNTDLHSPSLKPTSRMSSSQFIHNLRGVFKSQTINESDLTEIYERVKANQITTTPDHVTHVMKVQQGLTVTNFQKKELPNLCVPHRRLVCFCRLFEVYDVNKKERIGQHQREIFLFNDMLLVTKLARRARANTPQQYAYRQSIALQGLYVQLFQSAHYNFGIRLCRRSNEETLIMFNARNELDQSRFVDDLTESIAEMDEMESIRNHNVIETIHSKCQERLKRHAAMHISYENVDRSALVDVSESESPAKYATESQYNHNTNSQSRILMIEETEENMDTNGNDFLDLSECSSSTNHSPSTTIIECSKRRLKAKFNSMSNLASVEETNCDSSNYRHANGLRPNRSFVQTSQGPNNNSQLTSEERHQSSADPNTSGETQQSCSSASVHSLDSGLFFSRDVSPNQSS